MSVKFGEELRAALTRLDARARAARADHRTAVIVITIDKTAPRYVIEYRVESGGEVLVTEYAPSFACRARL